MDRSLHTPRVQERAIQKAKNKSSECRAVTSDEPTWEESYTLRNVGRLGARRRPDIHTEIAATNTSVMLVGSGTGGKEASAAKGSQALTPT